MSENNYKGGLTTTTVPMNQYGTMFSVTTDELNGKLTDALRTLGIGEADSVLVLPRLSSKVDAGVTDIFVKAYFDASTPGGNIFRNGAKSGKISGTGRINVVTASGAGQTGQFTMSDKFRQIIGPFAKIGKDGQPAIIARAVQNYPNVAEVDLDYSAVMAFALGVKSDDNFDFTTVAVVPIGNANYKMILGKFINGINIKKGKNSRVNYAKIQSNEMRRINGGGINNGGRSY